jgi:hypothetical protein
MNTVGQRAKAQEGRWIDASSPPFLSGSTVRTVSRDIYFGNRAAGRSGGAAVLGSTGATRQNRRRARASVAPARD